MSLAKLFLFLLAIPVSPLFAQVPGDWAFTRGNPEMTGVATTELRPPLELSWSFKTVEALKGKPEMML